MKEPFSYPLAHFPAKNGFGPQKNIPKLFDHAHFLAHPLLAEKKICDFWPRPLFGAKFFAAATYSVTSLQYTLHSRNFFCKILNRTCQL